MQTSYQFKIVQIAVSLLFSTAGHAQTTYFHQDFSKTTSLINPQPDTGQFSHIILTAPALSYHKFHKGYMELVRTQQDSATGGIIRIMRATPFLPNPQTLFIQVRFSAESVQSSSVNAMYFYVGEDFNPVNNSFPGNGLMFGKCSVNFSGGSFSVKDLETQLTSKAYNAKVPVTLTWVLNNSDQVLSYKISANGADESVIPGAYDLWVDNEAVHKGSKGYPGNSVYSKTKLSNFELRFRNGIGKIRIYDMMIREGGSNLNENEFFVAPNPVSGSSIILSAKKVDIASITLTRVNGSEILCQETTISADKIKITPVDKLVPGLYILQFRDLLGRKHAERIMVE